MSQQPPEPNEKEHLSDTIRASWNFSADSIRQNTSHFTPDEQEVCLALFRWCIDSQHPVRRDDAAHRIGFSTEMIYQLLTGKYRNPDKTLKRPSSEFIKAARDFLALEAKRFASGKTEFVMTPTARTIECAYDLARESQTICFIWGPSHIGKTWTAEKHYAPTNNHGRTLYCRMEAASGIGGMVRAMARAAGISDNSNTADLIRRIKNASSPNLLWILDEMHLLAHTYRKGSFHNCMEVIREIHDVSKSGMALMFTILDDLRAASQKELQQLWRRGVHKVPLPLMPTIGDLAAILKHHGFTGDDYHEDYFEGGGKKKRLVGVFPSAEMKVTVQNAVEHPREILRQVSKNEGLLAITERIRYAKKLANKAGGEVGWQHFVEAHLRIEKQARQPGEWV